GSLSCILLQYVMHLHYPLTASTQIYSLSLHDALPISAGGSVWGWNRDFLRTWSSPTPRCPSSRRSAPVTSTSSPEFRESGRRSSDRKSTRLNSSHVSISYAVFCLKKKT